MYSRDELIILAQTYVEATGIASSTLSRHVVGNTKLFDRLFAGYDCLMASAEAASAWFDLNWPLHVAWPLTRRRGDAKSRIDQKERAPAHSRGTEARIVAQSHPTIRGRTKHDELSHKMATPGRK